VQKGAPVDLLLGTDTLSPLGFSLAEKTDNATGTEDILHTGAATLQPTSTETAGVKLIGAARLPAGHTKPLQTPALIAAVEAPFSRGQSGGASAREDSTGGTTAWRPSFTRNYSLLGEWRVACRRSASSESAAGTVGLYYIGWNSLPSGEGQDFKGGSTEG